MAAPPGRTPAAGADVSGGSRAARDEFIDLDRLVGPGGKLAPLREPPGGESVVLGAGLHQLVLDKALMDRQDGDRVDLLVLPTNVPTLTVGPHLLE